MMDKARDLFDAAVSIARPLRESYVRRHAAGDETLMNEVLRLLEFDEPTTENAASPAEAGPDGGRLENAGRTDASPVRGYRLTQRQPDWHGGELWLAEPSANSGGAGGSAAGGNGGVGGGRVFIALLPRPDSIRAALSRWRLVRPQLDALSAPTIARIVEAGRTTDDRLFLVMPAFLPLTLNDWLLHHKPSSEQMLEVLRKVEEALAELAAWGMLHGDITADSIRLRAASVRPDADGSVRQTKQVVDVQLVGTGLMQIVALHTAKGRALSVEGDRAGLITVARRMVGDLLHRAGLQSETSAGAVPAPAKPETAPHPQDIAFRTLLTMASSQISADGGLRVVPVADESDNSSFLRSGLNKLRAETLHPAAAAVLVAVLAGTSAGILACLGVLILLSFEALFERPPNETTVVLLVLVCFASSAIAGGVVMSIALRRMRQERKSDGGARRS